MNAQVTPVFGGASTPMNPAAAPSGPNPFGALAQQQSAANTVKPVSFPPTPEQDEIVKSFRAGHDMVISAGAGTGKTSTITLLAEDMYQQDKTARGLYIAFNKSIANEVGSKLVYGNVTAMTVHSLAYRWVMNHPVYSKLMGKLNRDFRELMTKRDQVKAFGVKQREQFGENAAPFDPKTNPILYEITGTTIVTEAAEALKRFCQSDDDKVMPHHVRVTENIHKKARNNYRARVAEIAQRMWDQDIMNPNGRVRFTHDNYLKLYAMSSPDIPAQLGISGRRAVLFFDEAQDSRPCITQIVMAQRGRMQLVMCGDSSQAIYRFTGCRDAIRGFKQFDGVKTRTLSKTFRFGSQIAMVANQVLHMVDGSDVRIVPDLSIRSQVRVFDDNFDLEPSYAHDVDAVICRSNRLLIETAIKLLGGGVKVFCATDTKFITAIAHDFRELEYGGKPKTAVMKQFRSVADVERVISRRVDALTDDGVELEVDETTLSILTAITRNGAAKVLEALQSCERDESRADVVVSTIHKSKGRQWDRVMINWDISSMLARANNPGAFNDELMLLYVAVTRARKVLYAPSGMFKGLAIDVPSMAKPETVASVLAEPVVVSDDEFREITEYTQSILGANMIDAYTAPIIEQVMREDIKPHELVGALTFVSEKYMSNISIHRHERGHVLMAFLAAVGIKNIREVMDLSDSGMPDELLAAMLSPNEEVVNSGDLKRINDMLNPTN